MNNTLTSRLLVYKSFWNISTLIILAFAIMARIYFYYNHKDLWLDEASLAFCVYGLPLKDIFFQPLPNLQAAPLGFLLVSKGLGAIFGYSEYVLYFLPLISGICTLILSILIGKRLMGDFGGFVLLLLCFGNQSLLYYSTEFKQYGIEAFCSFLLIHIYMVKGKQNSFSSFYIAFMISILFSNTVVFIAIAIGIGIIYENRCDFKRFLRHNSVWIICVGGFFVLYYMFYLKFQRVEGFYEYWKDYFLPFSIQSLPKIKEILSLFASFTPLSDKYVWIYFIVWLCGICITFKERQDIFMICLSAMIFYIMLSVFKIYPFGHGGIIGSRLSLYMSPIFYLPVCYFFLFLTKRAVWLKALAYILLILMCYKTFLNHKHSYPNGNYIQQTHSLITEANQRYKTGDLILVYSSTNSAYKYYSFIDSATNPYEIFSSDLEELEEKIKLSNANTIYLLGSHYPANNWLKDLQNLSLQFDKDAIFSYGVGGWGSFLIVIDKNK